MKLVKLQYHNIGYRNKFSIFGDYKYIITALFFNQHIYMEKINKKVQHNITIKNFTKPLHNIIIDLTRT